MDPDGTCSSIKGTAHHFSHVLAHQMLHLWPCAATGIPEAVGDMSEHLPSLALFAHGKIIWLLGKTLVPLVNPKIAGSYGCSSH